MDPYSTVCPACDTTVALTGFYCQNCGKKLREKSLSISVPRQILIYFISFFLPPFGLGYGFKYLRQYDDRAKAVGAAAILLTLISIMLSLIFVINLLNNVTQFLNKDIGL